MVEVVNYRAPRHFTDWLKSLQKTLQKLVLSSIALILTDALLMRRNGGA